MLTRELWHFRVEVISPDQSHRQVVLSRVCDRLVDKWDVALGAVRVYFDIGQIHPVQDILPLGIVCLLVALRQLSLELC